MSMDINSNLANLKAQLGGLKTGEKSVKTAIDDQGMVSNAKSKSLGMDLQYSGKENPDEKEGENKDKNKKDQDKKALLNEQLKLKKKAEEEALKIEKNPIKLLKTF